MIPENFKEIQLQSNITEDNLIGCFLYNEGWGEGGYFNYGNSNGFGLSNGAHYNTITGDSLYDHVKINNFKVFKK